MLNPITPLPLQLILRIPILVPELHGDLVAPFFEREQFFPKPVVLLAFPFRGEESLDFGTALQEGGTVPPDAVGGVGLCDVVRGAGVPECLGGFDFLVRGGASERGDQ